MPVLSYIHQLFDAEHCQTSDPYAPVEKSAHSNVPGARARTSIPGMYHYRPGCTRYWCNGCQRTFNDLTDTLLAPEQAVGAPTGCWPPFCCACRFCCGDGLPESWGSIAGPAIAGAGGYAIVPCPTKPSAGWQGTVEADDLYHAAGGKGPSARRWQEVVRAPRAWPSEET